jgi:hypothetical protein
MNYHEKWAKNQKDQRDGKSAIRRTAEIILAIMNNIMPFLEFTMEIHEDFLELKLPTLDVKIWVVDWNRIEFDLFEKPMNPNSALNAKTALSVSTKFFSLSLEIVRRMLNASRRLPLSHGMESLEKFSQKMINSYTSRAMWRKWWYLEPRSSRESWARVSSPEPTRSTNQSTWAPTHNTLGEMEAEDACKELQVWGQDWRERRNWPKGWKRRKIDMKDGTNCPSSGWGTKRLEGPNSQEKKETGTIPEGQKWWR